MVKSLTKVTFKPSTQSTEEFIMIVNGPEYKKWKEGGDSIPLTDVVDSFKVFHSPTGNQGHLGEASKQQLENAFGSSKDIDVAEKLLKDGTLQAGDRFDDDHLVKNLSHGDFRMDTRGSGARMTGV
ncbi:DUF1960-domain-containing protein [Fomitiporia mediterranea MF3/22]|uniref:DUF1960-domain-containing protein n=1 Tax=Fomitiporia mediterranea (strain MF3/22) TaxID=694068 RepID=UPI00044078D3|nr:DUF1960-domain-containing protein [Fomitiporia mediterranea MF3/22]EJD01598.1 DUF1960-domain-containing protein [Fomitiporia mediterranea MF3/22]